MKVYAFVGPSGTGKSYRAQMIAGTRNINYIIDDGLIIMDNRIIAGSSAKKAKKNAPARNRDFLRFCGLRH